MKIGLLVIATNDYTDFLQPLITSADKHLLKERSYEGRSTKLDVTYFVFSNKDLNLQSDRDIIYTKVHHKPWPWMTLGRYHIFHEVHDKLKDMDFLYYCDSDMLFVDAVGQEILGERVGTIHPGFLGGRGTPESNPQSTAYIPANVPVSYCAGGFNGGSSSEFLAMAEKLSRNISQDFHNGIIAIWHDESHLNRYYAEFAPTVRLDPSYCYPESWDLPFPKKLLALDKNHEEIRKEDGSS